MVPKYKASSVYARRCHCDNTSGLMLLLLVCGALLLMYSYADEHRNVTKNAEIIISNPSSFKQKLQERRFVNFSETVYTYDCESGKCVKTTVEDTNPDRVTLESCKMMCGSPPLWPKPTKVEVTEKGYSTFSKNDVTFIYNTSSPIGYYLEENIASFLKNIDFLSAGSNLSPGNAKLTVEISLEDSQTIKPKSDLDESYKLTVENQEEAISIKINSINRFGARHALETLLQLIWFDSVTNTLKILHNVEVKDAPIFPHRGLMLDVARNFFKIPQLFKIIDGMAATKLNVFHLHLTDAESFPIILKSVPEFAKFGSYGPGKTYKSEDIQRLIKYAELNGIRVILESDAPGHVNTGWNLAKISNDPLVICGDVFGLKGHLNPDNEDALDVLEAIYKDFMDLNEFPDDLFHIGGDEVDLSCWRDTKTAANYPDLTAMWVDYTNKMIRRVKSANGGKDPKNIVLWSSPLTGSSYLKQLEGNITVQFWLGSPLSILSAGKTVIYSTVGHWYLDCGYGPYKPGMSRGNCDPYTPWQKVYAYRPWAEFGHRDLTLGGEACLWAEQVDESDLETRLWPRAAAFAERLWSDPGNFDDYDVYTRLVRFRGRITARGLKAAALWPEWCSRNPGLCEVW